MGVISAIGGYNFGCFNSLAIEHNELSAVSVDISHKHDKRRLAQCEKKNSSDWRKRISNKLAKSSKITKNIKKEGETYGSGVDEGLTPCREFSFQTGGVFLADDLRGKSLENSRANPFKDRPHHFEKHPPRNSGGKFYHSVWTNKLRKDTALPAEESVDLKHTTNSVEARFL
ncbi:hypothetical protein TNCV_55621 [Trichonephila clavipes]|nr:hypothetical protein TNCV_55621 [Trichonephila clavipes]